MTARKVQLMKVEELPVGAGREVEADGVSIAVFRLPNGKVYALRNGSPYRNSPLVEGIVSGEYVYCSLYNWKISLATGEVQKPDDGRVQTYPIEIQDGYVYITL
ncbi:nitrite reductase small subunit NirD [Ectobacillus ponti]|uniref:Nitrite reductase small subunit NirD n=1 Tax=Ectobacillus ponti TaxID=2961894 RepID=A0AA41X4F6_9BACI|nr:nitrite reductase small subunit NirD [Ectobacillus ponti]MCP8968542.1 nitrite reductase small subunit NirD [Ectobacillus ponti]